MPECARMLLCQSQTLVTKVHGDVVAGFIKCLASGFSDYVSRWDELLLYPGMVA